MILIVTHKEDYTADFIVDKLNTRSLPYFRLNCEDLDTYNYTFTNNNGLNPRLENLEHFNAVWYRRTKVPTVNLENISERMFIQGDYRSLLDNLICTIPAKKWMSHPYCILRAENKLYQLKIAQALGMDIPNTLVTSDVSALTEFLRTCKTGVVIKPIRHGKLIGQSEQKVIFTNKLKASVIETLEQFDLTPCIFQEYVEKEYELRVTIVNNKVFAAKVQSQNNPATAVDWRREKQIFESYRLPETVEKKCLDLTNQFSLSFSAIDLVREPSGKYVFLELNPNGQWAWLELESGLEISSEIISYLT